MRMYVKIQTGKIRIDTETSAKKENGNAIQNGNYKCHLKQKLETSFRIETVNVILNSNWKRQPEQNLRMSVRIENWKRQPELKLEMSKQKLDVSELEMLVEREINTMKLILKIVLKFLSYF